MLAQRANNWENNFDPNNDLLTARYQNGQFEQGIVPTTQQNGEPDYVEGDAYEYLWDVPNDYQALFNLLGGNSKVVPALQAYLSQPNGNGMFDEIANEFDLGEQFGLDYAGDPAGTQAAVRNIENTVYLPGPSGLDNNDDLGAESSSYLWQMLGLYPENPGTDTLLLNSPGFPHAQISLANGKTITINAPNATSEYYVSSLKINGTPDQKLYTTYSDLSQGATLDWTLSPKATSWGSAPQDAPPSYTAGTSATVGYLASQTATVAPGSSSTLTVGANNATSSPQKVKVSITAPSGVTITPSSATIAVPPHGTGTTKLTVAAAATTTQNFYSAPVTLTTQSTGTTQSLDQTILVAAPGSLLSTFNSAGIADDSDPAAANIDGDGNSYSSEALAAAGFTAGQNVDGERRHVRLAAAVGRLPGQHRARGAAGDGQRRCRNPDAGVPRLGHPGRRHRRRHAQLLRRHAPASTGSGSATGRSAAAEARRRSATRSPPPRPTATARAAPAARTP